MKRSNGKHTADGITSNGDSKSTSGSGARRNDDMPRPQMETGTAMHPKPEATPPASYDAPPPRSVRSDEDDELEQVLVEMRVSRTRSSGSATDIAAAMSISSFQVDTDFPPIPISAADGALTRSIDEDVVVVRGVIHPSQRAQLEAQPDVIRVFKDTPIAPFAATAIEIDQPTTVLPLEALGTCPIGSCDCAPGTAKGTIADVAGYLGVDEIHAAGFRGEGIVVGVVDGGITAVGRTPRSGETARIGRVIGGYPAATWGTTASAWGDHGNMCATDVLGMAPQAQLYDLRISDGSFISSALAAFQWAINQHRIDGTPHILTNSWGIFQETWDRVYATDPNHVFTRKVVEALDEGILVLFAAGNCGGTCPDGRCGSDSGPGRSIWGANGHPRVMTVGAVNKNEQFVGYSSQGPAALDRQKPDFCSITHFAGYFDSDSGTSAATPIAAGVVALLKQVKPELNQDQVKNLLRGTAKDIGPAGWDQHSGHGIIQAKRAFADLIGTSTRWSEWEQLGGYCLEAPAVASWDSNRLDTFVVGGDSALYHKWWDGTGWSGWENLGGFCLSAPTAVSWGPNRIDTFVVGGDNALYHKWWDGTGWSGWENLGGFCTYGPAAASWSDNRLDVFVIGGDSALWHKWWDGTGWSGWETLGGFCLSAPTAVSWGTNRIDTFVVGGDRALWHKWWDGTGWSGWENLGGFCLDAPAVASWSDNRLDVFAVGGDHANYHIWWDGVNWSGWENLGGYCHSAPAAVSWGPNRIDTFVIGADRALWHKWYG